jgi:hypothetical protein
VTPEELREWLVNKIRKEGEKYRSHKEADQRYIGRCEAWIWAGEAMGFWGPHDAEKRMRVWLDSDQSQPLEL